MTRDLNRLTIVAPFYNEENGVRPFYTELCAQLEPLKLDLTFIFVDDGSHDQTVLALNALADSDERVSVLSLSRNFGHQIALTAGLDFVAEGETVVVMDSDLQHPPSLIPQMIEQYQQGAEIVYGVRNKPEKMGILKRLTSGGFYSLMRRFANIDLVADAADFRLMSATVVSNLRRMREAHRFLRGMVAWVGYDYATVSYDQPDRADGTTRYTWRKMLQLARHGLFSFSTVPLDIITWLGLLLTGLATVYLIYILITAAVGTVIPGWTSTIGVLLLMGGVQLISIGVIAQYVGMIFEQTKDRPLYLLKQSRLQKNVSEPAELESEPAP